jgi:hypothetical protein
VQPNLSSVMEHGLQYLEEEQLRSGEVPNFRLLANGSWEYCFSPLPSAYVHDLLSYFDPLSLWFAPHAIEQAEPSSRSLFVRRVMRLRRNALRFLAWQQAADLSWRFYGPGSGVPPDADLTAVAATALVEARGRDRACDWTLQTSRIRVFCCKDGLYGDPSSRGDLPPASAGALRLIASCNALRYYALVGEPGAELEAQLRRELTHCKLHTGRPAFLWALARACRQGRAGLSFPVHANLIEELLGCQNANGAFGGPLSTALAMHTLLDLEFEGPELWAGRDALLISLDPVYGRRYEGFGHNGCGSSAWTTIAIITALARGARMFHA